MFERALMRTCRAPCAEDGQVNLVPSVHHRKTIGWCTTGCSNGHWFAARES